MLARQDLAGDLDGGCLVWATGRLRAWAGGVSSQQGVGGPWLGPGTVGAGYSTRTRRCQTAAAWCQRSTFRTKMLFTVRVRQQQ